MIDPNSIAEELQMYQRGLQLARLIRDPAWEIVVSVIKSYADNATDELLQLPPGDPVVPTAHAAAHALGDFVVKFQQDISRAITHEPSDELKQYMTAFRKAADPLQSM